jgi:D-alanyl-D-alanine carboxypeptidase
MDGIKTGYVRASGYNLAASVKRDGKSLIVVVFGGTSGSARNARVAALVEEYMPTRAWASLF